MKPDIRTFVPSEKNEADINNLLRQLSTRPNPTPPVMIYMTRQNAVFVGAFDGEKLVGMGSLFFIQTISKLIAHMEDVVVDENYQHQGIGGQIIEKLKHIACTAQARQIDATSKPERTDAHKLYLRLGFEIRNTIPFRFLCPK